MAYLPYTNYCVESTNKSYNYINIINLLWPFVKLIMLFAMERMK